MAQSLSRKLNEVVPTLELHGVKVARENRGKGKTARRVIVLSDVTVGGSAAIASEVCRESAAIDPGLAQANPADSAESADRSGGSAASGAILSECSGVPLSRKSGDKDERRAADRPLQTPNIAADAPDPATIDGRAAPPSQLADHFSGRTETTHKYDYSRRAYTTGGKLACGRRSSDIADYRIVDAHYPDDAANMVITDGLRAAVAVAKRASIPNARTYVEDAFRRWTERGAVSAGTTILEAQDFDPTPADNAEIDWRPVFAAEAEFVLRRIAELRRDGRMREARALRELLPERLEWRRWRGTLTERDRRRIAKAEANAAAFDAVIRASEIPDPKKY
jgi:hypothetical protein